MLVMITALLCVVWCLVPSDASVGRMHAAPLEDCDNVRLVECVADISVGGFVGLTMYNTTNGSLVTFSMRSDDCVTSVTFASCTFSEAKSTITTRVVLTDLAEGETRTYRCDVNYFDTKSRTKTYYVNVTIERKPSTAETTTVLMLETSENLQNTPEAVPTTASPVNGLRDTANETTATTATQIKERVTDGKQYIDVISLTIGACVTIMIMATLMVLWVCRRRMCRLYTARRRIPVSASIAEQAPEEHDLQFALARRPPAELPAGACAPDYQDATSTTYITPVYKQSQPSGPPERHTFRPPEGSSSSNQYEIVN